VLELGDSDGRGTPPAARPDTGHGAGKPSRPPGTDTERALARLLGEVLDVEVPGRDDDFFHLGGDSSLAVQLAARARDTGLALTARMVFEHPTLHELAAFVDATTDAGAATAGAGADTSHPPMSTSGLSGDELSALTAAWSTSRDGAP